MRGETGLNPSGLMRPCLLLLLAECPGHGYDLTHRLQEFRLGMRGGVYQMLRQLEEEDLVTSTWEEQASGPVRRTYRLTEAGASALDGWAQRLRALRCLLERRVGPAQDVYSQSASSALEGPPDLPAGRRESEGAYRARDSKAGVGRDRRTRMGGRRSEPSGAAKFADAYF